MKFYVNLDPGLKPQVRSFEDTFSIFKFINEQLRLTETIVGDGGGGCVNGDSGTQI